MLPTELRLLTDDERWEAVVRREAAADGQFFYSVRTTGVYCRPGCAARRPRREHVRFHRTAAEAERAGFRACKRCRPSADGTADVTTQAVAMACRVIERSAEPPTLTSLAAAVGLSPSHLHRAFKSVTGLTPKAYAAGRRGERVREVLASSSRSVTSAMYAGGFNSSGAFYAASEQLLGMTATSYRGRGTGETIRFAVGQCSLGAVLVAATERGVCAVLLGDEPEPLVEDLQRRFAGAELVGGDGDFEQTVARAVALVETPRWGLGLPLDVRGTAFQQRVWQELRKIPAGSTATYREIAARIGAAGSARAVAGACAANPIAAAIPCHRVVRMDGSLSGYRWGVERKRELLRREREG